MPGDQISTNDRYIIDESSEISFGELPWAEKFFTGFPAFRHISFRLYFAGQLTSLIGTWLQMVAQGWLVLQLTHSAFWVGAIAAIGSLPILFFSLFGGVIIDRLPKKNILLFTQSSSMILAFLLGILTLSGHITVAAIGIISFLLGLVNALDMPTRQAFAVEMVGKEDLSSAIAINSGTFNGARVIGPGIAGITIAFFSVGGAFLLNALSYLAVLTALLFIRVKEKTQRSHPRPLQAIKEGLLYAMANTTIRRLLFFAGVVSIFGWSYGTILPVVAEKTFHTTAVGLGYLHACAGMGAFVATLLLSIFSKKINNEKVIFYGSMVFVVAITLFTFTTNIYFAMMLLFFAGAGIILQFATTNSWIQHTVPDHLRGRVMSMYTLVFLGFLPIGSFQIGVLSEHFGTDFAIRLGAVIIFLCGLYLFLLRKQRNLPL